MSNIKEQIRQEIERQRSFIEGLFIEGDNSFYDGQDDAYNHLLAFIDSLQEEKPSEDLNDEIKKFIEEYGYERGEDKLLIAIVARHFAEWQKEQMMDEWLKDRDGCFWGGVEEGKKAMNDQLMKDSEEDALLLERARLTLYYLGDEEVAERLRQFAERKGLIWK